MPWNMTVNFEEKANFRLDSLQSDLDLHMEGRAYEKQGLGGTYDKRKAQAKSRHQEILKKNAAFNDHQE